jgi:hypothetical protein
VLELQETPASPIGRPIGFMVITMAIVWAYFGKIDIVAVAQGKIISSGHTKVIQPLEAGAIITLSHAAVPLEYLGPVRIMSEWAWSKTSFRCKTNWWN